MIKVMEYSKVDRATIFARSMPMANVADKVSAIIADVKANGDKALREYTKKFDGLDIEDFRVSRQEIQSAIGKVEPQFIEILKKAASNIRAFHEKQVRQGFVMSTSDGTLMGQKIIPIEKVGLYVPGGTAAYPSTVLMTVIPARIAGCSQIVMVTPPGKDGNMNPDILAAAAIAGVDCIYKVGGAQAVAALAYGTQSIPKVEKIVGPGNAFVAEAKKQVFGLVSIDMVAGPSEILVVADGKSNPRYVAADLLSQAEHDKNASAVLVTDSMEIAQQVQKEIEEQLSRLPREDIARASIENNGKIIVAECLEQAIEIANEIAPEHLELCMDNPMDYLGRINHAGSVFLGRNCPEALGDYYAGPNHTLPTCGSARFSSPLSVDDFIKKTQFTYYSEEALAAVADDIDFFAKKEGLQAHGRSVMVRQEEGR